MATKRTLITQTPGGEICEYVVQDDTKTMTIETPSGKVCDYIELNGICFLTEARGFNGNASILSKLQNMKARDDDIIVCGGLRSGTNWTWEIVNMLVKEKAENQRDRKMQAVLEAQTQEHLDGIQSPRILSTALRFEFLPKDFIDKKCKIVYVQRNPKDVAVSFYNYLKDEYESDITWEDWLHLFLNAREDVFTSWFGITKSFERAMSGYPEIHLFYFEEMKRKPVEELTRLANFLQVRNDPEFIKDVADKISFPNMKKAKIQYLAETLESDPNFKKGFANSVTKRAKYYRKGEVGDWKNYFTATQNELFNEKMRNTMAESKLKFIYE